MENPSRPTDMPPPDPDRPEVLVVISFWLIYGFLMGLGAGWVIWA